MLAFHYRIDYGGGRAVFTTPVEKADAIARFQQLALQLPLVRRAISRDPIITGTIRDMELPRWAPAGAVEAIAYPQGGKAAWGDNGDRLMAEVGIDV